MENKKFTDEEIFHAAEICFTASDSCQDCPFRGMPADPLCEEFAELFMKMLRRWKAERDVSAKD